MASTVTKQKVVLPVSRTSALAQVGCRWPTLGVMNCTWEEMGHCGRSVERNFYYLLTFVYCFGSGMGQYFTRLAP
eukprot:m.25202 g.25202  ORF g.25202 m.25202 type:complete len:75 (+) comp28760_c0_seq2:400-624(+)